MPRRPAVHKTATTPAAASNQAPVPKTKPTARDFLPAAEGRCPRGQRRCRAGRPAPRHPGAQSAPAEDISDAKATTALGAALLRAADEARGALALEDPVAAIHKTRRALKGARALLMLVEGELRPAARQLRRDLGAAARSLASTRDRHIIHDAHCRPHRRQAAQAARRGARPQGHQHPLARGRQPSRRRTAIWRRCARPGCRRT